MSWLSSPPRIDTSSRRWTVAVHEAAHIVAARQMAWRISEIYIGDDAGHIVVHPPHGDPGALPVQSAVISLAGPRASARQRWFLPHGCEHDERDARRDLRGTGVSYSDAKRQAGRLVDRHWTQIQRLGRQLYRDGRL
jgi:hypothetical protein